MAPDGAVDPLPGAHVTGVADGKNVDVTVLPGECKPLVDGDFQRGCVMYYADGAVVIENAYAGDGNPTPADLPCNLMVEVGDQVFQTGDIVIWYHCWTRPFWIVEPAVKPLDPSSLPPYGPGSETASFATAYANADNSIMGRGLSVAGMSTAGERPDIGLYPGWDAAYVTNPTSENAGVVRGMSDSVGAWPIHTRDTRTNQMLIATDYPKASMLDVFRGIDGNPFKKFTTACKNVPNVAHATAFNALAAQLFATDYDKASLSQWANWVGRLWQNYTYLTDVPAGPATTSQTRGMAWLIRTVVQGAKWSANPELFGEWATKLADFVKTKWSAQVGIHIDQFSGGGYPNGGIAPWQNHYLVSALGHAVQLGFTEFQWGLDYLSEFVIESALVDHEFATIYNNSCFHTDTETWVANWAEGLQLTRTFKPELDAALDLPENSLDRLKAVYPPDGTGYQAGDFVGYPWGDDGYPAIRQPAAAYVAMFATDQVRAQQAWEITAQHMRADFSKNPKYNIVPRST